MEGKNKERVNINPKPASALFLVHMELPQSKSIKLITRTTNQTPSHITKYSQM